MEGAALAGAGQRDRPRKGGKRTKASKAQELFEEEVKRLVKLIDVKLSLKSLRNVVEYEEALKSALASSASGTYGGMLVDVYVGVVSGSSPAIAVVLLSWPSPCTPNPSILGVASRPPSSRLGLRPFVQSLSGPASCKTTRSKTTTGDLLLVKSP